MTLYRYIDVNNILIMNIFSFFLFLDSLLKTNTFCKSDVYICEFYIFLNVGMGFEIFFIHFEK